MDDKCLKRAGEILSNYKNDSATIYSVKIVVRAELAQEGFKASEIDEVVKFLFDGEKP